MNRPVGIVKGMSTRALEGTARERLLAAANELFYEDGIHTVGIDKVIERAGVAKASLYSTFGSKDELIRAYLEARQVARERRITERVARHTSPRAKILAVFDLMGELYAEPTFRGCAFARAVSESAPPKAKKVCRDARAWTRALFTDLARGAGARDPDELGAQLHLVYDGATLRAQIERDPSAAVTAKKLAIVLLDAAT